MMEKFIPFQTLAYKEIVRILRIWSQTLIPPLISITIYFVVFRQLFPNNVLYYRSFTYLQFLTPGLILMPVITSSYNNTAGSFFSMKFMRAIEELIVSSISINAILCGFLVGSIMRGMLTGLLVLIISCLFTKLSIAHLFFTGLIMINTTILFGLGGLINAMYAKKFDDVGIIPNFILTPLIYLGGIFFPISHLPAKWQWIAHCNPILYLISSFRESMLGTNEMPFIPAITICVLLSGLLYAYTYLLLKSGKTIRS